MTQANNSEASNSSCYPTPEEIERAILEANRLRNEYIANLIIKGWSSLQVRQRRLSTRKAVSKLDNRLLRDVGLKPQRRT